MWVTFGHLRPSGRIMPDHGGDRGAVLLVLAPHDRLHIKQIRSTADFYLLASQWSMARKPGIVTTCRTARGPAAAEGWSAAPPCGAQDQHHAASVLGKLARPGIRMAARAGTMARRSRRALLNPRLRQLVFLRHQ